MSDHIAPRGVAFRLAHIVRVHIEQRPLIRKLGRNQRDLAAFMSVWAWLAAEDFDVPDRVVAAAFCVAQVSFQRMDVCEFCFLPCRAVCFLCLLQRCFLCQIASSSFQSVRLSRSFS